MSHCLLVLGAMTIVSALSYTIIFLTTDEKTLECSFFMYLHLHNYYSPTDGSIYTLAITQYFLHTPHSITLLYGVHFFAALG